ncbi:MAG: glutaredoxin family protein [Fidelibacterota bacterium]|jgi:glutaredoxin 3|nr:NrdH-redoxin [Candidatus Neomarinimicrobiota bacterium]|tara:strand:+ start:150 stop:374 length:225 start_codon:yes stop_codon:yes gene_type:complete
MKTIEIYTTNWCGYCKAAKRFFDEKGWNYEEINIEEKNISREELSTIGLSLSVPQIIMDGEAIGGYDDLMKLYG